MDSLLFHPKVVHLPLGLAVVMPLVTLVAAWWQVRGRRDAFLMAALLQAVLVAGAWVAMNTGEDEEDRVEAIVAEKAIHDHEEAGEAFAWGATAVLGLAVATLLTRSKVSRGLAIATVVGTLVVLGLGVRVGEKGGALVYRHGAASAYGAPGSPAPHRGGDDDDRHPR